MCLFTRYQCSLKGKNFLVDPVSECVTWCKVCRKTCYYNANMQHVKMMFVYANLVFLLFADATASLITKDGVNFSFNMTFPEPAKKLEEFSVVYVNESSEIILFDVFNGLTYKKYDNPYRTRVQIITLTPNGVVFKLHNVTVDDAGKYVGIDTTTELQCDVLLIVLGKPSKPVLYGNAAVESGNNLLLSCSSHSTSRPPDLIKDRFKMHYIWRRNHVIVQKNYSSNLAVGQISRGDNGVKYSCQAEEQEGLTSDWSPDAVLDVLYGPHQVVLAPDSSIYDVSENGLLEIACSGDCRPACMATWLDQKGRTVWPATGNRTANRTALRIRPTINMTGMYRCDLSNNYGKASTNFYINVIFGPIVKNFTVNNNKKVTVKENDEVNFICTGDSNTPPVVTFIADMISPIVRNSTSVPPHGFNSSYTISSVSCTHQGRYYCQVSNSTDTTHSVDIKVECPIQQEFTPIAIIVAAFCSLLFVIAAICAAVYINRYKNRKGQVYSIHEEDGMDVVDERSLYARVNKPKIKPCKAKKREGGDVYTTVRKTHTQPKPCTNHLYMASGRPSEGQALIHRDADDRMSGNVNNNCGEKNAEGLTYADLDLAPPTMVNGQPVINSKEEPVVYEEIDFSQTPGPQLPEKIWEKEGSAP